MRARCVRSSGRFRADRRGFALVMVLILLTALYLGATGMFLVARAELRIGVNHVASSQAFYLAEAGLATWMAASVQPATADYEIGEDTASVVAIMIIRIDSVTAVYDVVARAAVGGPDRGVAGIAARTVGVLGMRVRSGSVRPIAGSWREVL